MKLVSSKNVDKNRYELKVSVGAEEFSEAVERAYRKNSVKINVPGFRKGKAPKAMIYKMYGEGIFYEDAVNELYPKAYDEALAEAGLDPVAMPKIEITEVNKDGFSFTAEVVTKPEVTIKAYKGIKAEKKVKTVEADEVMDELTRMRQRGARVKDAGDREARDGDIAIIDFEGFVDGKAFDGGKGEKHNLKLGSGQFIPGFEGQVLGHRAGDEFDINVTFPEQYQDDLKGKEAVFKIKLHELREEELPELDDEFAKDVSEYDTLDELKKSIESKRQEHLDEEAETELENSIIESIIENMEADIPEEMLESKVIEMLRDFEYRLKAQGIPVAKYIEYMGETPDSLKESFKEPAEKQVKVRLALEKIAELEAIKPTDEEIDAEYSRVAERFGGDVERIKSAIPKEEIASDCAVAKAIDIVKENAVVSEVKEEKPKKAAAKKADAADKPKKAAKTADKAEKKPAAKKSAAKADTDNE